MITQELLQDSKNVRIMQRNYIFLKALSDDFILVMDESRKNNLYIVSEKRKLSIKVKPDGYIPKSGFLLIDSLEKFNFNSKSVLDIGCGETGILAHYLYSRQADSVVGIDIDPSVILHVKHSSSVSENIHWLVSDLRGIIGQKFDTIVSNPPQMPMPFDKRKELTDWHDSSGDTGTELIHHILKKASVCLNPDGEIFILIFDFLGVKENYNNSLSIEQIGHRYGFSCDIVNSYVKTVRKGGQTEKSIPWIKYIYPKYHFKKNDQGDLGYNTLIAKFKFF